jgi:S1-C subfamily serine protease
MEEMTQESAMQNYRLRLPANRAVVVTGVLNGSPAENAGLEAGDVILEINRRATPNIREVRSQLTKAKGSKEILMTILPQGINQRRFVLLKLE